MWPMHSFTGLGGITFQYLDHAYNDTRTNERAVEIPMALNWVFTHPGHGLEVGNVLSHYWPSANWPVVDAFERAIGVTNVDIMDFNPMERFDWIVSISTVEHIGWDEAMPGERDVNKSLAAIAHMRSLLRPDGQMFLSFPTGIHPGLDAAAGDGSLNPIDSVFLKRTGSSTKRTRGTWEPAPFESIPYMTAAWSAGGVWVGVLGSNQIMPA